MAESQFNERSSSLYRWIGSRTKEAAERRLNPGFGGGPTERNRHVLDPLWPTEEVEVGYLGDPQPTYQAVRNRFDEPPPPTISIGEPFPQDITVQFTLQSDAIVGLANGRYRVALTLVGADSGAACPPDIWTFSNPSESVHLRDFDRLMLTVTSSFSCIEVQQQGHYRLRADLISFEPGNKRSILSIETTPFWVLGGFAGLPEATYTGPIGGQAGSEMEIEGMSEVLEGENQTRRVLRQISSTGSSCAIFKAQLDLHEFVQTELTSDQTLGSIFTVSGTPETAYATTCQEYVGRLWPTTGPRILSLLLSSIKATKSCLGTFSAFSDHPSVGSIMLCAGKETIVVAKGHKHIIVEVAELLQWFTATFRPYVEGTFQLSRSLIRLGHNLSYFEILPMEGHEVTSSAASCWHTMFEGFNLAAGFPTPPRGNERGVELRFEAMNLLGLIWYPCQYRGKLFLKGDRTALLPTAPTNRDCVQWHFIQSNDEGCPPLWDSIKRFGENMVDLAGTHDLASKRMFVGHWPDVEIHLGTKDSGSEDVCFSGANFYDKRKIGLGDFVATLGTSGLGFFTAQVSAKVLLARTPRRRIEKAHNNIYDDIRNSKQSSILLYDSKAQRPWLVPELSVVLHLALAWASYQDRAEEVMERIPYAEPGCHGGEEAYKAIHSAINLELPEHIRTDERRTFLHLVADFFQKISWVKDQQTGDEVKEKSDLVGYEFRDIAAFERNPRAKMATIDTTQSANWPKLLASKPDIAVLLCSNLSDPIQIASWESNNCLTWNSIQRKPYFLMASLPCIRHLSQQCGGGDVLKLYNDLYCVPNETSSRTVSNSCDCGYCPGRHILHELSNRPPKETPQYSDNKAIIIGKISGRLKKNHSLFGIKHDMDVKHSGNPPSLIPNEPSRRDSVWTAGILPPESPPQPAISSISEISEPGYQATGNSSRSYAENSPNSSSESEEELSIPSFSLQHGPLRRGKARFVGEMHPGYGMETDNA